MRHRINLQSYKSMFKQSLIYIYKKNNVWAGCQVNIAIMIVFAFKSIWHFNRKWKIHKHIFNILLKCIPRTQVTYFHRIQFGQHKNRWIEYNVLMFNAAVTMKWEFSESRRKRLFECSWYCAVELKCNFSGDTYSLKQWGHFIQSFSEKIIFNWVLNKWMNFFVIRTTKIVLFTLRATFPRAVFFGPKTISNLKSVDIHLENLQVT